MDAGTVAPLVLSDAAVETITLRTARFGEMTVARDRVLEFPRGLVGLPGATRFVFLHPEDATGPFFWLQSVDDAALAFVVCESQHFFPNYTVPLTREEQQLLHIRDAAGGIVCLILVVPEDPRKITANLRGPLVVNTESRLGMQLVLQGDGFPTKALLFGGTEEGAAPCSS